MSFLLLSQKNEIFSEIELAALNPQDFQLDEPQWQDAEPGQSKAMHAASYAALPVRVSRNSTDLSFEIYSDQDRHGPCFNVRFRPAESSFEDGFNSGSWGDVLNSFRNWLSYVDREVKAPDLWSEMSDAMTLLHQTSTDSAENTQFDSKEAQIINKTLDNIHSFLLDERSWTHAEIEKIESHLEYLRDRISKVGRIDWKNIFIATIINLSIDCSLNPETLRKLITLLGKGIKEIYTALPF